MDHRLDQPNHKEEEQPYLSQLNSDNDPGSFTRATSLSNPPTLFNTHELSHPPSSSALAGNEKWQSLQYNQQSNSLPPLHAPFLNETPALKTPSSFISNRSSLPDISSNSILASGGVLAHAPYIPNDNQQTSPVNMRQNSGSGIQLPTTSPISSFNSSFRESFSPAPPSRSTSLFRNQSSSNLNRTIGTSSRNDSSLFRTQSSSHIPTQPSNGDNKRRYSSLFGNTARHLSLPDSPKNQSLVSSKRPRTLTAPSNYKPSKEFRDAFYKNILPSLSPDLQKDAANLIKYFNDWIDRMMSQYADNDKFSQQTDSQMFLLRKQATLNQSDQLRLNSLIKSGNIFQIKKTVLSEYLAHARRMLDKLYKGEISDYKLFHSQAISTANAGEDTIRRAIERLSISAATSQSSTSASRSRSLFSQEANRMDTEESFGPYGPGVGSLDRAKIEKLLDNIKADVDIKPADRRGTPKEMKITLLEHQKLGLTWLQNMEASVKGGILADDMGLGKTIQTISLLVTNKSKNPKIKTTLIVAPVALLKQWEREIKTRIKPEYELSVCLHHGISRKIKSFDEFEEFDVVLTTYGLISREYKEHFGIQDSRSSKVIKPSGSSPFFQSNSKWYRVVLDEAQYIKNKSTLASKACSALESEFRWCLSGTPMQNSVLELYSLLRFLRIKPYDDENLFNHEIGNPIQRIADKNALKKLQALLKAILLRRTKTSEIDGKPILQLPPRTIEVESSNMDEDEQEFYRALEQGALDQMNQYLSQGSVSRNYSTILVLLLRLRQACCHPKLIERAHRLKASKIVSARSNRAAISLCRKFKPRTLAKLDGQDIFTCPICMDAIDPVNVVLFFPCGDFICTECCGEFFESVNVEDMGDAKRCPTCSGPVSEKELIDYSIFDLVHTEGYSDQEIMANRHQLGRSSSKLSLASSASVTSFPTEFKNDLSVSNKTEVITGHPSGASTGFTVGSDDTPIEAEDTQDDLSEPISDSSNIPTLSSSASLKRLTLGSSQNLKSFSNKQMDPKNLLPILSPSNKYFRNHTRDSMSSLHHVSSSGTLDGYTVRSEFAELFPNGWISSSKIEKCLQIIANVYEKFPGEKVIVFSQFTSLLDFVEIALEKTAYNPKYLRYDGSMTANSRNQVIMDFYDKPEFRVLLISLKAGNVGLTLTCASHIIIMDPFWNPFVEEQAMDRAHRIGQMRPVYVHRLVIEGTVEDRILELQKKKRDLISGALDEKGLKSIGKLDQKELLFLFGIGSKNSK